MMCLSECKELSEVFLIQARACGKKNLQPVYSEGL
jgi:hypothetical protein